MFVRNLRAAVTFTKLRVTYKRDILIIRQSKKYQLRLNSLYKLISLICFLSSSISIKSAEIRGRIIDAQRGQPIRGANVFVSPGEIEAQSKDDGRFILLGVPKSEVNIKILNGKKAVLLLCYYHFIADSFPVTFIMKKT